MPCKTQVFKSGQSSREARKNSGIVDAEAQALADATILHFTSQIGAVDKAIALAIENDSDLRSKRDLLLSILARAREGLRPWVLPVT